MTKINGRYNLIAKDMEPKEFTEELSSLIQSKKSLDIALSQW